jgi:hypothetical protein
MRAWWLAAALVGGLLVSWSVGTAPARGGDIKSGFLTGTQYRTLDEPRRRAYAMGLIDGIFLAPFFEANKQTLEVIERCTIGMQDGQIMAILDKFLRDNPARWHQPMNLLGFVAMEEACAR